ncbi:hypothetical protein FRC14_008217 [Serendipita sp. 396]|nr:hypothetical protein FRC14_008217 [Serendipita sp. 396]
MSSKAIPLTLKSRKIGLLTLPNELLFVIVSDVLANFFHNMILHPNVRRIWNGLHTLRRVSRKLKTMAEEIWTKAVGPWNGAHTPPCLDVMAYTRVLLHNQVRTIQIPEIDNVDKPLLIAYLLYGIGLFAEMRREKSRLPPGLDQLDDPESGEFWFYKGLGMATRTSPWDMAQVITANLMTHLLESKIASLLRSVDYLVDVARDRSSVALDTSVNTDTLDGSLRCDVLIIFT